MTNSNERWQLPDGIEELLPEQAARLEGVRRLLLDLFAVWGYEFVMPPLIEFTESLLVGLGEDLDLQTFKVIDQLSGRMLGIRADITPQTARMDAHSLGAEGVQRLCYAGSVLHAKPSGLKSSRAPIQVGAELYGVSNVEADIEVISLMLEGLSSLGVSNITLDLGHVAVYKDLVSAAGLEEQQASQLFDLLQTKSLVELDGWLQDTVPDKEVRQKLRLLATLNGGEDVLAKAAPLASNNFLKSAIEELGYVASEIKQRFPAVDLYFDLSELRGYNYHSGLVFAAYVPGIGRAIANGGRYDDIGAAFGRARPATGFNADLKALLQLGINSAAQSRTPITMPASSECNGQQRADLWQAVVALRAQGEIVINDLNGTESNTAQRLLEMDASGNWQVVDKPTK